MGKRSRITKQRPFELETTKRRRHDEPVERKEYTPLWKQIEDCFELRPDITEKDLASLEYLLDPVTAMPPQLTVASGPNLTTEERSKLKVTETSEKAPDQFKARKLNKSILSRPSRLPDVAKRVLTMVEEFGLSKSNRVVKAVAEKLAPVQFKARPLDKKVLEGRRKTRAQGRRTICPLDVRLATEERSKARKENEVDESAGQNCQFKARDLPKYNFFEPAKKQDKPRVRFEEFNFATDKRADRR